METKCFSLSMISKPIFTTNDIRADDYPKAEAIIQRFSRKLIVNEDGKIEYSDIVVKDNYDAYVKLEEV